MLADGISRGGSLVRWCLAVGSYLRLGRAGVCCRIQQKEGRKERPQWALGARLASLGSMTVVEGFSRLCVWKLSKHSDSKERPFVCLLDGRKNR
jgi:hypothetical protein